MNTCFSEEKLIKQFGTPFSKRTPPPLFVQILKIRTPTLILGGGGEETMCPYKLF